MTKTTKNQSLYNEMMRGAVQVSFTKWLLLPVWAWIALPFTGYIYRQITETYWGPEKYMPGAPMRKRYYLKKESLRIKK